MCVQRVYLLQAETEADMRAWMRAIQSCTEHQLVSQEATGSTMHQPAGDVSASVKSRLSPTSALVKKSEVLAIRQAVRVRNLKCVDCNQPDPEWCGSSFCCSIVSCCVFHAIHVCRVSLNLCVKMCVECSGVHRSMGVHVSKVRSLTLDAWDADSLRMLDAVTNDEFNAVWEAELHGGHISKPGPTDSRELKEQFAHAKYVDRAFVSTRVRDLQVMIDDSPLELAEVGCFATLCF
jgi:Arf-GAP/coiled-coil/ANK repeat/PH domain-containing protein